MMSNSSFLSCEEFGTIPPKKRGGGGGCGKIQVRPTILEIIIIIYKSKKQTRGTIMLFQNPLKTLSFFIQNLTTIINCLLGFQNHRININCIFSIFLLSHRMIFLHFFLKDKVSGVLKYEDIEAFPLFYSFFFFLITCFTFE